ncbi:MAG: TatD family hydrolase [Longicatena sp.]
MDGMIIDTHCHITCDELFERIDEVVEHAFVNDVKRMLIVCTGFKEYERAVELKAKQDIFDIALGFHPNDLYSFTQSDYERLESLLAEDKLIAVGEIGLDYHWDDVKREDQKVGFIKQIELAKKYQKPILIHMREATKDTIDIIKENGPIEGIVHCYSGSYESAEIFMKLGFYLSFGGPITFKNSRGILDVVEKLPLERVFVESDCPYLTPHPFRGKQNEPMYVKYTLDKICEIKNIDKDVALSQLQENYHKLFKNNTKI